MEPPNGIRRPTFPIMPRPVTLGEILLRAEGRDHSPPTSSMVRVTSPTTRLGPLANGRPRRPRTMNRPSTSAGNAEDDNRARRRRAPLSIPALARRRSVAADARIQNFYSLVSRPRQTRRASNARTIRSRRHNVAGRAERLDLFSFGMSRNGTSSNRQGQTRPRSNASLRARIQRSSMARPAQSSSSFSRMIDIYESEVVQRPTPYRSSFMTPSSNGRARNGRPSPADNRRNGEIGRNRSDMPSPVRRFVDFAAEFIPVRMPSPNAEPPEWSFDITPADFGPFAIGRSAVSRDRSLAMIAALSQIQHDGINYMRSHLNTN